MGTCMSKEDDVNILINSTTRLTNAQCSIGLHAPPSSPSSSISNYASSTSSSKNNNNNKNKEGINSVPLKINSPPIQLTHHSDTINSNADLCSTFISRPSPTQRSGASNMPPTAVHARSLLPSSPLQRSPTINGRGLPHLIATSPNLLAGSVLYAPRSSHESAPPLKRRADDRDLVPFLARSKSFTHHQPCLHMEDYSGAHSSTFRSVYYPQHPVAKSTPANFHRNLVNHIAASTEPFDESPSHHRQPTIPPCNNEAFGEPRISCNDIYPNRQPRRTKRLHRSRERRSRSLSPSPHYLYNNISNFDAAGSSFDFGHYNGSQHPDDDLENAPASRKRRVKGLGGSPVRSKRDALVFLERNPNSNAFKNQEHLLMYPPTNITHKATLHQYQRGSSIKNKVSQNQEAAPERRNVLSELPVNCCSDRPAPRATRSYHHSKQKLSESREDFMDQIAINIAYRDLNYSARSSLDSSACAKSGTDTTMKDSYAWKRFDENCDEATLYKAAFNQRSPSSTRTRQYACDQAQQLHSPLHAVQRAENNGTGFNKREKKESMASSISKACSFWEAVVDHHMANLDIGNSSRIISRHSTEDGFKRHPSLANNNIISKRRDLHLKEAAKEAFSRPAACCNHSINNVSNSPHAFGEYRPRVCPHAVSPSPKLNKQTEASDLGDNASGIDQNRRDIMSKTHESCTLAASDSEYNRKNAFSVQSHMNGSFDDERKEEH